MKIVRVSELRGEKLTGPVFHPSGVILLKSHELCTDQMVSILENGELPHIIIPDEGESIDTVIFKLQFEVLNLNLLEVGQVVEHAVFDDENILLLPAGSVITEAFKQTLEQRNIEQILVKKKQSYTSTHGLALRKEIEDALKEASISSDLDLEEAADILSSLEMHTDSKEVPTDAEEFKQALEEEEITEVKAEGALFSEVVKDRRHSAASEELKETISDLTLDNLSICRQIHNWFSKVTMLQQPSTEPLSLINEVVSNIMAGVIEHKDIMGLSAVQSDSEDYLTAHSLAVGTVACLIGTRMELGVTQVKTLTCAGLLADVGMLRIPKTIVSKPSPLDSYERARIMKHTEIGLEMLLKVKDLPYQVPWVVYQSHERCDGSGYPKGKSGHIIHLYSKIIAVSDIFVAMCAVRPYRDALLPYSAIEALLNLTSQNKLDPQVVRALLEVQSLFPIGSLVQLEDGRVARVVASNPEQYTRPVIVVLSDNSLERINLLDNPEIKVVKPLPNPKGMKLKTKLIGM
ncbi:MAG: HD domain-containing protein [Fibrobacter sp.]|nr:HD domain-containing protein [Fibrobacter sp.]